MIEQVFLGAVVIGTLLSLTNWRRGIYLMIVIAALQDPVRKLMPGAPGYMVLPSLPIWGAVLFSAFSRVSGIWDSFRDSYRQLSSLILLFALSLIPAAGVSATYGPGSWKITLIGLFSYGSIILAWLVGFAYPKVAEDMSRVMAFYCLVTTVMLVGGALEYLNLFPGWGALGARALGHEWIRYLPGYQVRMIAGFYRSPDIMGWHAAMTAMIGATMAIYGRLWNRYVWLLVASWGLTMVMLSGRRKMTLMVPVFAAALLWIYWRSRTKSQAATALGIILSVLLVSYAGYEQLGRNPDVEEYYLHTLGEVPRRVKTHGYESVIETFRQSGFWGEGIGSATQGTQHLNINRPRVWQEGGLEKLLVELGVPGFVCFIALVVTLVGSVFRVVIQRIDFRSRDFALHAGMAAIFFANAGSFVVSHQIYGDPFILIFFSLLMGFLLSAARPPLPDLRSKLEISGVREAAARP